jgi:DNA-binding transcriptional ArsR family regulator
MVDSHTYIIKDPEVAKLLADETRRQILNLLRKEENSATDLAKALGKNHSSIVHHLNTLLDAGLIEVAREEKVRNMIQPYYRTVAHNLHVAYSLTEALSQDPDYAAWQEDFVDKLLQSLEAYNMDIPDDKKDEVKELLRTMYYRRKKSYEERIDQRTKPVETGKYAARSVAHILSHIQLMRDEEYMDALTRLSEIIGQIRER